jgi:hypothetical protein
MCTSRIFSRTLRDSHRNPVLIVHRSARSAQTGGSSRPWSRTAAAASTSARRLVWLAPAWPELRAGACPGLDPVLTRAVAPQPANTSSVCYIRCFFLTMLGPRAGDGLGPPYGPLHPLYLQSFDDSELRPAQKTTCTCSLWRTPSLHEAMVAACALPGTSPVVCPRRRSTRRGWRHLRPKMRPRAAAPT